jgi:hypothetical protein
MSGDGLILVAIASCEDTGNAVHEISMNVSPS